MICFSSISPCTLLRSTGKCFFSQKNCADASACTTDTCNPSDGVCLHAPYSGPGVCVESNVCSNGTVCDDLDKCTLDSCTEFNECNFTSIDAPPSPSPCAYQECNPATGQWTLRDKVCPNNDPCMKVSCNSLTGQCVYTPKNYLKDVWEPVNPGVPLCKCNTYTCNALGEWDVSPTPCPSTDSCVTMSCDCNQVEMMFRFV